MSIEIIAIVVGAVVVFVAGVLVGHNNVKTVSTVIAAAKSAEATAAADAKTAVADVKKV